MATVPAAAAVDAAPRWVARLALGFSRDGDRTTLTRRAHIGPLVVQKPFHPEGPAVCQVVVVHPPGGIAGGDDLALSVDVGEGAHAQVTTPGAAKWYRTAGGVAHQRIDVTIGARGVLEWMPQGGIVYDAARTDSVLSFDLADDATLIAWDVTCLGRHAMGERFSTGRWRQRIDIVRGGAPIWSERVNLVGGSRMLDARTGLNGAPVFGTFVAVSPRLDDSLVPPLRGIALPAGEGAVTRLPHALVARWRGPASDAAHRWFVALWSALRPAVLDRAAVPPRIWTT
jgi:urease accessory protein